MKSVINNHKGFEPLWINPENRQNIQKPEEKKENTKMDNKQNLGSTGPKKNN